MGRGPCGGGEAGAGWPGERQAERHAARRESKGLLRAGAHQGRQDVVAHQAQGPVRDQIGRHGAGSVGALGQYGGGNESDAGADAGGAARAGRSGRGDAEKTRADACRAGRRAVQPSGLGVGAEARWLPGARVHPGRKGEPALAARSGAGRRLPEARGGARAAGARDDPRRRDRRLRREWQAFLQRDAEPQPDRRVLRLRSAAFRRRRSAQGAVCGPAALSLPMPAAVAAGPARAYPGRRRHPLFRGARQRLRGRDRQAQGQPLRGGQALGRVAQGQVDQQRRLRRRRIYEGAGRARAAGRAAGGLLGGEQAAICLARRLGIRRSLHGAGSDTARAAAPQDQSVRHQAGAECARRLGSSRRWSPR